MNQLLRFQSPPPMREATEMCIPIYDERQISIPASHAGGDFIFQYKPCLIGISIPASHAGGDATCY